MTRVHVKKNQRHREVQHKVEQRTGGAYMTPKKKRQLLLAGGFGLVAALMLLAAPELGAISAVGSLSMGVASAVTTMIARH